VHNLAGKYRVNYGTPFDLSELAGIPLLDVSQITHVRLIDVVGSIDPLYGTLDSQGNYINDPFTTPWVSSGFDLDGVAVLNSSVAQVPQTSAISFDVYPNPFREEIYIDGLTLGDYQLIDATGREIMSGPLTLSTKLNVALLPVGVYTLVVTSAHQQVTKKLVK
jgi:hypothetical protein